MKNTNVIEDEGKGDISTLQKGTCHALVVNASCRMFHLSSSLAAMIRAGQELASLHYNKNA